MEFNLNRTEEFKMAAANKGITRKTTATKYKQGRNLTIYLNDVKRSGKEKREDSFVMIDSEELIELADTLRDEHEMSSPDIAKVLLNILADSKVNMTFGDEVKSDETTSKFDIAGVLAELKK